MVTYDNVSINKSVQEILREVKLRLVNGKLASMRSTSSGFNVTCPFHAHGLENRPSCYINDKGIFHCFTCDVRGTLDKFIAGCFQSSVEYARQWLGETFHVEAKPAIELADEIVINRGPKKKRILPQSVLQGLQSYCPYLAKRKISREVCAEFNIKYDPKTRQVVFPCYDKQGDLIMLARRSIDTKSFFMDEDVEKPIYCLNWVLSHGYTKCLLVQGLIDTLTGYEYGCPTIGLLGQPSTNQINIINKSGLKVIYLATDNDPAGQRFRRFIKQNLDPGILVIDVYFPAGKKDINDLTREEFWQVFSQYY